MNDRYEHLLRKACDAKRGGYEAWRVQSTSEKRSDPTCPHCM